jgi:hypothetical protein
MTNAGDDEDDDDSDDDEISAEGRRECVAALEVRSKSSLSPTFLITWLKRGFSRLGHGDWQEAERAYLLWKARQVADAAASFATVVMEGWRTRGEGKRRCVEAVPEELRGRAVAGGGGGGRGGGGGGAGGGGGGGGGGGRRGGRGRRC